MKHAITFMLTTLLSFAAPTICAGAPGAELVVQETTQMSNGEIKKVDKDAGKVTIKHGELKNLDMPPMTMVFRVKDPSMLENLKAGDQVGFVADKVSGQLVVTRVEVRR